jgi:hypothetical protein
MSKHTPEPWGMRGPSAGGVGLERAPDYIITPPDFNDRLASGGMTELVAFVDNEDNLHRIVACVNALAGIPDPAAFVKAARDATALLDESLLYIVEVEEFHKTECRTLSKRVLANLAAFRTADKPA